MGAVGEGGGGLGTLEAFNFFSNTCKGGQGGGVGGGLAWGRWGRRFKHTLQAFEYF